jgi:hypothetical protein
MIFRFESPWLLSLLLLIPLLGAYMYWASQRSRPAGLRFSAVALAARPTRSWRLVFRPLLTVLRLLAMALIIIAIARPQTGQAREIVRGEGVDIALAVDISGSMASLDFEPQNRLEAAKRVISEFVQGRTYDAIGLVVFASNAFSQSPPTTDHNVLLRLLDRTELATDLGIDDGTAIGMGLANAGNMLKDSDAKSKVIVLLTDGVNNSGEIDPLTAAEAAKALGIKVYTIGMGRPGQLSGEHTGRSDTARDRRRHRWTLLPGGGFQGAAPDLRGDRCVGKITGRTGALHPLPGANGLAAAARSGPGTVGNVPEEDGLQEAPVAHRCDGMSTQPRSPTRDRP